MTEKSIIREFEEFEALFRVVQQMNPEAYFEITIKPWEGKRSLDQNSLYWMWLGLMAKYYSRKAGPFSKDDMHDLMRHHHLGYVDKQISKTRISSQLKSTTELSTKNMSEYMTKVEAWNAQNGLLLPRPEDQEHAYNLYREAAL